ncbi:MAG: hypothetical protein ACTHVY_13165 [Brevibacterium yomogidense]|uniref:hypothetical protein n=1 Tax=Brevibacterium sp. Mu109 TaxID=1255669 RepID=UPI000C791657|nr:hypothetical protein [Brevibacterium sp. Mu109]
MSTTAAIADSVLTDAHLHTLGLVPLGTETTVESVALAPEYGSACVARTGAATRIVDGGDASPAEGAFRLPSEDEETRRRSTGTSSSRAFPSWPGSSSTSTSSR